MAKTLDQWYKEDVKPYLSWDVSKLGNEFFFRDPQRPMFQDNEHFYSPADGIILYQKEVQPDESIVEIKGMNYTLKDVMGDSTYDKPSLVIGIFMTFYSVHINRIPMGGILTYESKPPIQSHNKPMLAVEHDLLAQAVNPANMDYLKYNERMVNHIYNPRLGYNYHVVQIADEDVNVIAPFKMNKDAVLQNERFSLIRWGSQCELVLPLDSRFKFHTLLDDTNAVYAGLDKLVKIEHV